jgi:hypothetical protein
VILVIIAIGCFAYSAGKKTCKNGGGGSGGGGTPCNQWNSYRQSALQPPWASQMPKCEQGICLTPGVVDVGTGGPCMGGVRYYLNKQNPEDTGILQAVTCQAAETSNIPYSGGLYHITRSKSCGPWKTTTDASKAFAYKGTPVCYPTTHPASGVIATYDKSAKTCKDYPENGHGWALLANDMVPETSS